MEATITALNHPVTSTLVKRDNSSAAKSSILGMLSFATRSTADDVGFLCDVGEASINVFCGDDTDSTAPTKTQKLRNSINKSGSMEKLRNSIKRNGSLSKLTPSFPTKSKSPQKPSVAGKSPSPPLLPPRSHSPSEADGSSLHSTLALEAGKSAHQYLEECLVAEVSILDRDKFNAVPEFQKDQLNIGVHLGKGSYSDVFEVMLNVSIYEENNDSSIDDMIIERLGNLSMAPPPPAPQIKQDTSPKVARDDITATSGRRPPRARRVTFTNSVREPAKRPNRCDERQVVYAMKCLRPQIRSDAEQFIIGAEDLVHETALLATLDHPNIIKLHGRAAGELKAAFTLNDGYFILLDRLKKETLKDCIGEWWRYPEFFLQGPTVRQIDIAHSIADAIAYLHSKKIVYRDLKPANVGFDSQGAVKLFDFGFAAGLPEQNDLDASNPGGLLFDKCGTPRYMAPEVGLELGYRTEADVYSFGILLWEMCALTKPFEEFKRPDDFERAVFIQGVRPSVKKHWPVLLCDTMKKCWSNLPSKRPSIDNVKDILLEVKTSISGGGGRGGGERRKPPYSRATRRLSLNMGHGYILG